MFIFYKIRKVEIPNMWCFITIHFFQTKQIIQWASSFKAKVSCTNYFIAHNDDLGKNFNHWGWSHNNCNKNIEGWKKSLQLKIKFNLWFHMNKMMNNYDHTSTTTKFNSSQSASIFWWLYLEKLNKNSIAIHKFLHKRKSFFFNIILNVLTLCWTTIWFSYPSECLWLSCIHKCYHRGRLS